jgi:hypothetical protein
MTQVTGNRHAEVAVAHEPRAGYLADRLVSLDITKLALAIRMGLAELASRRWSLAAPWHAAPPLEDAGSHRQDGGAGAAAVDDGSEVAD